MLQVGGTANMLCDPLQMEQGFAHDKGDILLFHGRIKSLLMVGSNGLAA